MITSQTPIHLQYRNATYYGQLSNYKRHGKGMLILDTSTVIFADWKDNTIDGTYIYLSDGIRAYGTMNNGKLDGYNVISTTSMYSGNGQSGQYSNIANSHNNNNNIRTFYGSFRNQKLYGRCIMIDNDQVFLSHYSNNQVQQINRQNSLRERELFNLLNQVFPNHLYTLEEHLTKFIKTYVNELEQMEEIARYQPCINAFGESQGKFYGFQQVTKPIKKFGIILRDNQLISVGEHTNHTLQGIGRLYDRNKQSIIDGCFRAGKIESIGIDFNITSNKFILQVHDGSQDRVERGFGFPIREILEFRKEFHLRSIFFYNDIAVLNLKQKYETMIGHIFVTPKRATLQSRDGRGDYLNPDKGRFTGNSRSASKKIASSPLREKLSKYQMESDVIQDNSPMRNRPNQYRSIDKTSGYFREDSNQRSPYYRGDDRQRTAENQYSHTELKSGYGNDGLSNSRRFNNNTHGSNRSQDRSQDRNRYSQENRSRNKFQERETRQNDVYNEILRQNPSSYYDPNPSQSRASRTQSNYQPRVQPQTVYDVNMNRGRKDTRDLVKQLETQEKGRRLALDEIYSKSNLYGRNKR